MSDWLYWEAFGDCNDSNEPYFCVDHYPKINNVTQKISTDWKLDIDYGIIVLIDFN